MQADPAVDWTSDGIAWAAAIGANAAVTSMRVRTYTSVDSGQTWTLDATPSGDATDADRAVMWVGHSPSSPFKDQIYLTYHFVSRAFVVRRTAGTGGAWQTPVQVSGSETTGTPIGGDVKTNSFGDVFVFWPDTGGTRRILVIKSTNGGVSFGALGSAPVTIGGIFTSSRRLSIPAFPFINTVSPGARIYVSGGAYRTATKNLVYAVWPDLSGASGCSGVEGPGTNVASPCKTRIWFSRSTNGGATWSASVMLNNQASLNDQFQSRLVVDESNGNLVVVYYDTVSDPGRLKTDLWVQTSTDDGVIWSTASKVTTAQTDETVADTTDRKYGDYLGCPGFGGTFFAAWTDRRNGIDEIWTSRLSVFPKQGFAWGSNNDGQLGDGTTSNRSSPTPIIGSDKVVQLATGGIHSLALRSDGSVLAWGLNTSGELGDGGITTSSPVPVPVTGLGSGSGVIPIAAGGGHSFALKSDGSVLAWGINESGQLGDGTGINRTTPVTVKGLGPGSGVIAIAGGNNQGLALKRDGSVLAWGFNGSGELGDGTTTNRLAPVVVTGLGSGSGVVAIAMGADHGLALKSDGSVLAWGFNEGGELGDGTTTNRLAPVPVTGLGSGSGVIAVAGGFDHSLALKRDGSVLAWGFNPVGELGDGTTTSRTTPALVKGLGSGSGVTAIVSGWDHGFALKSDGSVLAWGYNVVGQLGDGTNINRLTPTLVKTLPNKIFAITAGGDTTLAIAEGLIRPDSSVQALNADDQTVGERLPRTRPRIHARSS